MMTDPFHVKAGNANTYLETGPVVDEAVSLPTAERRIMRRPEVEFRSGLKRAQLYKMMRSKEFPAARRIGKRAVGWYSDEVERWIAERTKARL